MTSQGGGVPFKLSYVDFAPLCAGAGGVVCTPDYERFKSVPIHTRQFRKDIIIQLVRFVVDFVFKKSTTS